MYQKACFNYSTNIFGSKQTAFLFYAVAIAVAVIAAKTPHCEQQTATGSVVGSL